jgi:hypothetical protein
MKVKLIVWWQKYRKYIVTKEYIPNMLIIPLVSVCDERWPEELAPADPSQKLDETDTMLWRLRTLASPGITPLEQWYCAQSEA